MDRPPSQESTLTDTSIHDSLFSNLSTTESAITEPAQTSTEVLPWDGIPLKGEGTTALPGISFSPVPDPVRESQLLCGTGVAPS